MVMRQEDVTVKAHVSNRAGLYPLFHDVVSVVGHLLHDAEGGCVDGKDKSFSTYDRLGNRQ